MNIKDCWECVFYNPREYKVTYGKKNISGKPAWYKIWGKTCDLSVCYFRQTNQAWVKTQDIKIGLLSEQYKCGRMVI